MPIRLFLRMALKVYFGDKAIYIGNSIDDIESKAIHQKAVVLNTIEEHKIADFLTTLQNSDASSGIISYNTAEALAALKKHFTFIEAAGGFILNNQDKVLMIFRRGKWDLPKGKLDEYETLEGCALREVKEETGISARIVGPLGTTYHTYLQGVEPILKISHWYSMKAEEYETLQPQTEEDIELCEWVRKENIATYFEGAHPSIQDILKKGLEVKPV